MNSPFNPAFAAPAYGYPSPSFAMSPYGGYGTTAFGADPAAEKTFGEKATEFLNTKTGPLENKFWLGAALLGGVAWYGASAGWFGRRR